MRAHFAYLKYVIVHKWFVFWACVKLGVPLHLAIWHDMSRFSSIEWFPYVHTLYYPDGTKKSIRDNTGAYDPDILNYNFSRAWLHHQHNKHHWQAWVSIGLNQSAYKFPIPRNYILEMIADWIGANKAGGGDGDVREFWKANKSNMMLHSFNCTIIDGILEDLYKNKQ